MKNYTSIMVVVMMASFFLATGCAVRKTNIKTTFPDGKVVEIKKEEPITNEKVTTVEKILPSGEREITEIREPANNRIRRYRSSDLSQPVQWNNNGWCDGGVGYYGSCSPILIGGGHNNRQKETWKDEYERASLDIRSPNGLVNYNLERGYSENTNKKKGGWSWGW